MYYRYFTDYICCIYCILTVFMLYILYILYIQLLHILYIYIYLKTYCIYNIYIHFIYTLSRLYILYILYTFIVPTWFCRISWGFWSRFAWPLALPISLWWSLVKRTCSEPVEVADWTIRLGYRKNCPILTHSTFTVITIIWVPYAWFEWYINVL